MSRSKIASFVYEEDTQFVPKKIISMDSLVAKANHEKIKPQILTIGPFKVKEPKKPKSEKELFDEIIDKNLSITKVRKYFKKRCQRLNEEESSNPSFLDSIPVTV